MLYIDSDQTIHLTRGDIAVIDVTAQASDEGEYIFKKGDIVRLKVFKRRHPENVVLEKDVLVDVDTTIVTIELSRENTKIGDLINRPMDFWYEIEINPETEPQTIVGYDNNGPKIFRLYPEGDD